MAFSAELRGAIQASGKTVAAIAEQAGIPNNNLYLFMQGKRGLSLETIDKLWELLGLMIVTPEGKKELEELNRKADLLTKIVEELRSQMKDKSLLIKLLKEQVDRLEQVGKIEARMREIEEEREIRHETGSKDS